MSGMGHSSDGLRPSVVQEQLRRLLFLVPYVAHHPGITVTELAAALSISKEALLRDLDLLTMVGRPPFQPDDFVDIYVENEKVHLDLDQRFSKPPRLTAAEATALAAAAELLQPAATDTLTSALQKLARALPAGSRERFEQLGKQIDAQQVASSELSPLTQAILEKREAEFDYFSAHRGKTERRTVRPYELFSHRGLWYLSAFCLSAQEKRLFRLDRVRGAVVTSTHFQLTPGDRPAAFGNGSGDQVAKVRFSSLAAPYVRERMGASARSLPGGELEVTLRMDGEAWLIQWVLSFGGEAEVLEPASARSAVLKALDGCFSIPL